MTRRWFWMAPTVLLAASTAQAQYGPPVDLLAEMTSHPAAVSQNGVVHIFYRGPNDRLWTVRGRQRGPGPLVPGNVTWSGGEDLNAPMTSGPAAVVWRKQQRIDVFYRGPNGHLWTAHYPDKPGGQWWSGGEDLNVDIVGSPSVVSRDDETLQVFFRGTNDHLWTIRWPDRPGSVWWSGGEDLNAEMTSSPAAAAWPDGKRIDVFYRGRNGNLWLVHWPDRPGGSWWSGGQDLNAAMLSGPGAYAARMYGGSTGVFVFYRGANNQLTQSRWPDSPGGTWWSGGMALGAQTISEPSPVSAASLVVFQGENGRLWYLGPPSPPPPPPRVTLTAAPNNGHIKVGASATVSWSVSDCGQGCTVSLEGRNGFNYSNLLLGSASVANPGSLSVTPTDTHTKYTVTARSGSGSDTKDVVVQLDGTPPACATCAWHFFRMTQQGSLWTNCFTIRVYAPDEATAKQLAEAQNGGFKAESITEQQFLDGCK